MTRIIRGADSQGADFHSSAGRNPFSHRLRIRRARPDHAIGAGSGTGRGKWDAERGHFTERRSFHTRRTRRGAIAGGRPPGAGATTGQVGGITAGAGPCRRSASRRLGPIRRRWGSHAYRRRVGRQRGRDARNRVAEQRHGVGPRGRHTHNPRVPVGRKSSGPCRIPGLRIHAGAGVSLCSCGANRAGETGDRERRPGQVPPGAQVVVRPRVM